MSHTKNISISNLNNLPKTQAFLAKMLSFRFESQRQKNQAYKCLAIMESAERKQGVDNKKEL